MQQDIFAKCVDRCVTPLLKVFQHLKTPRQMTRKHVKNNISRNGVLLGGFVPRGMAHAIEIWISKLPERDKSTFIREAAREKLRRDGIEFSEREVAK